MDNSAFTRLLTPRPSAVAGRTDFTYTGENVGIPVGNAPSILDKDYTITADVTIPSGGAEGMIATLGGRFGGYGLFLSHSANFWFRSPFFKALGWGLLLVGLLLILLGKVGRWSGWKKGAAYSLLVLGLLWVVAVFATGVFGLGRGRPVFVYNLLDLERFRWEGLSGLSTGKHTIVFDLRRTRSRQGRDGSALSGWQGSSPQDDTAHDPVAYGD